MDIVKNWDTIRKHFSLSFASSLHCSIATVDINNTPNVTSIGTVFLNYDQTGFYFERYTSTIPKNAKSQSSVCILAVNSSKRMWFKSLFKGRFIAHPAIKLFGVLGEKRKASDIEMQALKKRMRFTKRMKGHMMLWDDMDHVRELVFHRAEKMKIGAMTNQL